MSNIALTPFVCQLFESVYMKEWYLSSELVGLEGMANSATGVSQKAKRNKWLSRKSSSGSRALEYHISNFHPDVKKQLIERYVDDENEAEILLNLEQPTVPSYIQAISRVSRISGEHLKPIDENILETIKQGVTDILEAIDGEAKETEIRKLARKFSEERYSHNKLVEGLVSTFSGHLKKNDNEVIRPSTVNQEARHTDTVIYYDITASAGAGHLVEYEPSRKVELNETLKLALNIQNPSKARLLNMEGDSMLPTLKDKSILAIEELENFKQDGVYVFTFDSTLYVKRLQKNRDGIKVISDNPIYDAWFIKRDEVDTPMFTIHGRVTGCAQSV